MECVIKERSYIHGKSKQKSWLNHLFFTLMLRFSWLSDLVWLFVACFMVLLFLFGFWLIEMGSYSYCRITAASSSEVVRSSNHHMMHIFTLQNNFFNFQPLFYFLCLKQWYLVRCGISIMMLSLSRKEDVFFLSRTQNMEKETVFVNPIRGVG